MRSSSVVAARSSRACSSTVTCLAPACEIATSNRRRRFACSGESSTFARNNALSPSFNCRPSRSPSATIRSFCASTFGSRSAFSSSLILRSTLALTPEWR
jgi:hypothetical protein